MALSPFPYQQVQSIFTDVINNVFSQGTLYNFLSPTMPPDGTFTQYGSAVGVFSQREDLFLPSGGIIGNPNLLDVQTNYIYISGQNGFIPNEGDQIQLASDSTQSWMVAMVSSYQPIPGLSMAIKMKVM